MKQFSCDFTFNQIGFFKVIEVNMSDTDYPDCLSPEEGHAVLVCCSYYNHPDYGYSCVLKNAKIYFKNTEVFFKEDSHLSGKCDADVQFIHAENSSIKCIPNGIEAKFQNLNRIELVRLDFE